MEDKIMRLILNILWLLFGGLFSALGWVLTGCLWCITVVGIPVGLQCFKLASISLDPFGKEIVYDDENAVSFLLNILDRDGNRQRTHRNYTVHNRYRNPVGKTVFQDREAFTHAFRSKG